MKAEQVIKTASALYNHCKKDGCRSCPFAISDGVLRGCPLYRHPLEWEDEIIKARKNL